MLYSISRPFGGTLNVVNQTINTEDIAIFVKKILP